MNYTIIGLVFTALGIIFTIVGTLKQDNDTQKFQNTVITTQSKNIELSEKLAKLNEEKFKQLTKPEINIANWAELNSNSENAIVKIIVKNTGNNDCFNCKLIIDKTNSPLGSINEIVSFNKVPKGINLEYSLPIFKSKISNKIASEAELQDFRKVFFEKYLQGGNAAVIHFHFEFTWNDEEFKSSQFTLIKTFNKPCIITSSQQYIED
jgi:hypothetical protein